jgi:hypothetical protein
VTGESKSSNTVEGRATISADWNGAEARFLYSRVQQVIRNEAMSPYREVIVETLREADYNPQDGNYDTDLFPADLGDARPIWTVSFSPGALVVSKPNSRQEQNSQSRALTTC